VDGGGTVGFLEGVPLGQLLNGGGWAIAFWVTWFVARLVYTGRLVPRSTHEDTVKALEIERTRNASLVEQVGRMTDAMETVEVVIRALPQPPPSQTQRRGGGR
jgi:predicted MFS family arabinose efflux permease